MADSFSSYFLFIIQGYMLADRGYDVWMGNARGNSYSRQHVNLSTTDDRYWRFTYEYFIFPYCSSMWSIDSVSVSSIDPPIHLIWFDLDSIAKRLVIVVGRRIQWGSETDWWLGSSYPGRIAVDSSSNQLGFVCQPKEAREMFLSLFFSSLFLRLLNGSVDRAGTKVSLSRVHSLSLSYRC